MSTVAIIGGKENYKEASKHGVNPHEPIGMIGIPGDFVITYFVVRDKNAENHYTIDYGKGALSFLGVMLLDALFFKCLGFNEPQPQEPSKIPMGNN